MLAVGVHDFERAESLINKDVDVLVVDKLPTAIRPTSSRRSEKIKKQWDIDVVAGNVATVAGASRPDRRR